MIDVHIHSSFSFDSQAKPEEYLKVANAFKIPVIGFSEHYDYDAHLDGDEIALADVEGYVNNIEKLKKEFPDINVLCGIEFGYRYEAVERYRQLVKDFPFDYVINSVHTLKGRGDCYHDTFFEGKPLQQSYSDYFKAVLESIDADYDYQIIGHIGYVSRYRKGENAKLRYCDFPEIIDNILNRIIERDKCLEINTSSGTSQSDFLPDKDIIERYLQLGGKNFSYGSDAHRACDYLRKHDLLLNYLKNLGVNSLCYYQKGKKIEYKI